MAYLLHIESSSTVCSVAISKDDKQIAIKEINTGYTHAENLHVFINELLHITSLKPSDLNAISVSSGPGSYTGLRIGYSTAKGLAYALQIPLISINTLKALSVSAIMYADADDALYIPLMDARRMEVYSACYSQHLEELLPPQALVLSKESIHLFKLQKPVYFFGDGISKAKEILLQLPSPNFIEGVFASATSMIKLAFEKYQTKKFEDIAYAEPNYLKEFFFTSSKK